MKRDLLRNEEGLQQLQSEGFEIIDEDTPADADVLSNSMQTYSSARVRLV